MSESHPKPANNFKPKKMLLLFINKCQLNFWNQVFIEAIVTCD